MRNSLRLVLSVGGAAMMVAAGLLVACSDDTSVSVDTKEAGADATPDSPADGPGDGGPDTSPPFDGGFTVDKFDSDLADEVCKALARCCYGSPTPDAGSVDGGSFDDTKCRAAVVPFGFEGSNFGTELRDAGNVVVDQVAADACIKKVRAMTCNLPGAEFTQIRTACFGAYSGKLAVGAACTGSIECTPGSFCKTLDGGTTGSCTALRTVNGPCGDFTTSPSLAEEACSYRRGGDTGNHCQFTQPDAGDWKCTPSVGVGGDCQSSIWCTNSVCEFNNKCTAPDQYWATSCEVFVK